MVQIQTIGSSSFDVCEYGSCQEGPAKEVPHEHMYRPSWAIARIMDSPPRTVYMLTDSGWSMATSSKVRQRVVGIADGREEAAVFRNQISTIRVSRPPLRQS